MKNVFKIFFLLSFLCSLASFAREVKLIQITDINLTEQNAYKFEKTIEEINEFKDIDFVLLGGNNIANSNIDNLNTFTYLINKINKRCIVLLGSSDVYSSKGIDKEYYLEVSSVGLERELRNLEEIKNNIGKYINVKTYEKIMVGKTGIKEFEGHLLKVEDNLITMNFKMKQFKKEITIPYEKIAKIRLAIEF